MQREELRSYFRLLAFDLVLILDLLSSKSLRKRSSAALRLVLGLGGATSQLLLIKAWHHKVVKEVINDLVGLPLCLLIVMVRRRILGPSTSKGSIS